MRTALLLVPLLVSSCNKNSDRDLISEIVDQSIQAANDKHAGEVVKNAADDFVGPSRAATRECRQLLTGYFLGQGWVHVFEKGREISVEGDSATVSLDLYVAVGREVKELEDYLPTNGTHLAFELTLAKTAGGWKYKTASYSHVRD